MEQRRTVLLADTSTEFRILLREAMEKTGEFWVDVAQTGDEVLEKVQEQEPDILIMDVILPGLDGLSALRELQELGYAPMTILTSAFVSDQTLAEATELGAAYFLPKPFRMDTLLDRMRNLFWEKPKATRPSLKARVSHMLHDAGMPANISGYQYLREAILITAADPSVLNKAVTKILYPEIARRYGTTALRVERCIRSAIETAWDRASPETLPKYFGCTVSSQRGKPSNAEFIALLAERLTLEDDQALRARQLFTVYIKGDRLALSPFLRSFSFDSIRAFVSFYENVYVFASNSFFLPSKITTKGRPFYLCTLHSVREIE